MTKYQKQSLACGLHSNFPPCCVDWFVNVWSPLWDAKWAGDAQAATAIDLYNRAFDGVNQDGIGEYVLCPDCLEHGIFNELVYCKCRPEDFFD